MPASAPTRRPPVPRSPPSRPGWRRSRPAPRGPRAARPPRAPGRRRPPPAPARRRTDPTAARRRLDAELVRRGLAPSRERAREAIRSGRVRVGGAPADKPARLVAPDEPLEVVGPPPRYVGRGGEKLAGALDRFDVHVAGQRAVDCGASTGGFTDCLLQAGAAEVVAIDVGYGQLHEKLRADERVRNLERTTIRGIDPDVVGGPAPLVVGDLSFISLRTVADDLLALLAPGGDLVLLVKPQFEAGREEASRGRGIISDPEVWRRVLGEVRDALSARGAAIMGAMCSPLVGADGNVEFLVHAVAPSEGAARTGSDDVLDAAVAEARARRS
ncbi:TlyA family rRNA (cytidine-2'-O)-methyltransferase [Actinomarinicola tropica]|uniref:TlyA family rRNA (Cytidine-2'-O)-methyltransferase n=1 Tax=Actinomarinicola tropica TaxID=2789776 RepID=A0A5Q2RMU8_9ACTN|nr:TlyA family rRNA (cytidine-2'-O)-methyltransferase [Actinomarinicola tropica]